MAIAHSKVTAQRRISVPMKARRRHTSEDIHRALFRKRPRARSVEQMKAGVRGYMKKRHARG